MISYVISASPFAPCHASMYIGSFAWLNLRKTPYYSQNRSFAFSVIAACARNKTTQKLDIDNTLFLLNKRIIRSWLDWLFI